MGVGYYKQISKDKNQQVSISAGFLFQLFNIVAKNGLDLQPLQVTNIKFLQQGIYINPSFNQNLKTTIITIGLRQSFIKYKNITSVGAAAENLADDELKKMAAKIQAPTQFYFCFSKQLFNSPIGLNAMVCLNTFKRYNYLKLGQFLLDLV